MDLLGEANYCGHVVGSPRSSPRTIRTHAHALDVMSSSHARRTFSLALAALIASLACGTALAHQAPLGRDDTEDNAGRALLDHDADWFRTIDDGGAHNALDLGKPVGDQATATTCNGRDDFVRTAGDQFTLGGEKFVFAGWNQWEVLEAASGAPPPFRTSITRQGTHRTHHERGGGRRAQSSPHVGAHGEFLFLFQVYFHSRMGN